MTKNRGELELFSVSSACSNGYFSYLENAER